MRGQVGRTVENLFTLRTLVLHMNNHRAPAHTKNKNSGTKTFDRKGDIEAFIKVLHLSLKSLAASLSELLVLEHLKNGQHDHVALHQSTAIRGHPLRISDFCLVKSIKRKGKQLS